MYYACRGPTSTSRTSTIVEVLVIFGYGYSRRRLRTFLSLYIPIVCVLMSIHCFVLTSFSQENARKKLNTMNGIQLLSIYIDINLYTFNFSRFKCTSRNVNTFRFTIYHNSYFLYVCFPFKLVSI